MCDRYLLVLEQWSNYTIICLINMPFSPLDYTVEAETITSSAIINWSFASRLETRNQNPIVKYGISPGNLDSSATPSQTATNQYSVRLESLQPGTEYFYQLHISNNTKTDMESIKTKDSSKYSSLATYLHLPLELHTETSPY